VTAARAVFLDRDGVLNRVVWREGKPASPRSLAELEVEPAAAESLERLKAHGFRLFGVTNQPDVRRGRMSMDVLEAIHQTLCAVLPIEEISACVHDDRDGCRCRKPQPGLILELAARHDIEVSRSWMIGDQDRDVASARAAGCRAVLLARSYNSSSGADLVVPTLLHAVAAVVSASAGI
jgi:D-glycero-D-manno-heptose 1,7-bisphosphate phosphatase